MPPQPPSPRTAPVRTAHDRTPPGVPGFSALLPYWPVTLAALLGWFLDAFDQTTLLFTMPDIAHDLGCSLAALGSVLMAQAVGRALGNAGWGWLADRFGRKPAFMLGVLWFSVFTALTGLSHSLLMLMVVQFMGGIGFGGTWTASATLLMESVPERLRPMASALMMSGYELGYLVAAAAQALILPHYGWRVLFFIGLLPALLSFFIRLFVSESPAWRHVRQDRAEAGKAKTGNTGKPHRTPLSWTPAALQAVLFMTFLEFQKAAIYTFYPTVLRGTHHLDPQQVFWPVSLYCVGSFLGKLLCGVVATRLGNTRVMLCALGLSAAMIWPFLCAPDWPLLLGSAFVMGMAASGIFALVPDWLAERFPAAQRSFGMGLSYAIGSLGQGVASKLIPYLGRTPATLPLVAVGLVLSSSAAAAVTLLYRPPLTEGLADEAGSEEVSAPSGR
ncbi:MFS transporter [Oecophyllibacter saccharovorans]|uniref:MFS transporter n=1 Tax=Oecophyllibacter saccharovorans TaxID=2558360 RepID=A0A506UMN4_9PROT|nr:MFS transporter [Oecophyllibacter saccharovorans]